LRTLDNSVIVNRRDSRSREASHYCLPQVDAKGFDFNASSRGWSVLRPSWRTPEKDQSHCPLLSEGVGVGHGRPRVPHGEAAADSHNIVQRLTQKGMIPPF
jgi:hypothetical protein